jgi:Leucine-rich repeat (LRR) protein
MNHWNAKSDLKTAFDALTAVVPFKPMPGLTERVASAEKALGRPLPTDLRSFYETFPLHPLNRFLEAANSISIFPVDEVHVWRGDNLVERESLDPAWAKAEFLVFGGTIFGDELLYNISKVAPVCLGAILVTDHEVISPIKVLSENLADWLARIAAFSGIELAVVPGCADDIASNDALAFAEDHLRLNPDDEWAARKVYAAHTLHPDSLIYWDERERRLRPIEEMPWLENVSLSDVEPADLHRLAALKELNSLHLSRCSVADLAPLAFAQKLEWLGIYDFPDTSVAPLAALTKLNQLRTLRTLIRDVAALAAIPALNVLEITDSAFDDVAAVAQISSLTALSLSGTQIETLAPLVALQRLTYLQVNGTRITDLAPAVELPHLESLIVSKGAFPRKVLADVRRRRPELELLEW